MPSIACGKMPLRLKMTRCRAVWKNQDERMTHKWIWNCG